jgi:hypothetical protein
MNKLIALLLAVSSVNLWAGNKIEADAYLNNGCSNNPTETTGTKDSLTMKKRLQADEQFKNFSENNQNVYQQNF